MFATRCPVFTTLYSPTSPVRGQTIFQHLQAEDSVEIDIQVAVSQLEDETIQSIYGVALTTAEIPAENLAQKVKISSEKKQVTDLVIRIKDVLIVIEAKRTKEDCAKQLSKQLAHVAKKVVQKQSITWEEIMLMIKESMNVYQLLGQEALFLQQFRTLIQRNYASWLPTSPFCYLNPEKTEAEEFKEKANKRLDVVLSQLQRYELDQTGRRGYIAFNEGWASEVIPKIERWETTKPTA